MTALADSGPGQVIRWHYLAYSALALAVMTAAITSHERRFLNFVHVICGVLWTGIDLFMGFVIGPIFRRVDITVRREMPALRRGHSGAATQSRPGDSCEATAHAAAPCGASGRGAVEEPVLRLRRVKAARYQHSRWLPEDHPTRKRHGGSLTAQPPIRRSSVREDAASQIGIEANQGGSVPRPDMWRAG
jgi:hypothetical protein